MGWEDIEIEHLDRALSRAGMVCGRVHDGRGTEAYRCCDGVVRSIVTDRSGQVRTRPTTLGPYLNICHASFTDPMNAPEGFAVVAVAIVLVVVVAAVERSADRSGRWNVTCVITGRP